MTIYASILVLSWAAFLLYWFVISPKPKEGARGTASFWWARFLVALAVVAFLYWQARWGIENPAPAAPHPLLSAIGAACAVIGIAFAIWSRYHLGRNWGMPMRELETPDLVTTGPYAYVRHPIYTGVILALFGSTLVSGGWWFLIFIAYAAYFIYAATREEKAMLKKFPSVYPSYQARTKMLIPFVF